MNTLDKSTGEYNLAQRVPDELSARLTARIRQRILTNKGGGPDPSVRNALHAWLSLDDTQFSPCFTPRHPAKEKRSATDQVRAA